MSDPARCPFRRSPRGQIMGKELPEQVEKARTARWPKANGSFERETIQADSRSGVQVIRNGCLSLGDLRVRTAVVVPTHRGKPRRWDRSTHADSILPRATPRAASARNEPRNGRICPTGPARLAEARAGASGLASAIPRRHSFVFFSDAKVD